MNSAETLIETALAAERRLHEPDEKENVLVPPPARSAKARRRRDNLLERQAAFKRRQAIHRPGKVVKQPKSGRLYVVQADGSWRRIDNKRAA